MALLKYFPKKVDVVEATVSTESSDDIHGASSNPGSTPCSKDTAKKKPRGAYMKLAPEEKATIGRYASEHGVSKAVKHFKDKSVKDSSVRDWMRAYNREVQEQLRAASLGTVVEPVLSLPCKTRGRPPILEKKLDYVLQEKIKSMREHQAAISSSVVIGVGRAILMKHDKMVLSDFGGPLTLNKEWARSVMKRMGFSKRRANSKSKVTPNNFSVLKEAFLFDICSVVKMEEVPDQLVLNWDHTAIKIVPSSSWTMEKRGTKRVEIEGLDDRHRSLLCLLALLQGNFFQYN